MRLKPDIRRATPEEEYYFKEGCHILELSNTPADPELSIARARVAPGVSTRLHRLIGITEYYVILQGQGLVSLDGQPPRQVRPSDVVVIPPRCTQQITNTGPDDLVFLAICSPRFITDAYEALNGPVP